MIKKRLDEIFEPSSSDETIYLSDDLPTPLESAIKEAQREVENGAEFSVVDIGKYQRPIEYGFGDLQVLQTDSATIFTREEPEGDIKMISVGRSPEGPLQDDQIREVLFEMGGTASLTPEEMDESRRFSVAIRSLKQSKSFVDSNVRRLLLSIAELQKSLSDINDSSNTIDDKITCVELDLHNLLSSVYTFHETAISSLKTLEITREYRHYIQKYRDSVSTAMGLRHCIQHNFTLKVQWTGRYLHDYEMYEFDIGIPVAEVKDPDIYTSKNYSDASGEKHAPIEYFYSSITGRNIDLEQLAMDIRDNTQETYGILKSELEKDENVVNENINKLEKIQKFYIEGWQDPESK